MATLALAYLPQAGKMLPQILGNIVAQIVLGGSSMNYRVTAKCESGHTQAITVEGMPREWAEMYAGLLDGTHAMYLAPPCDDPNSVIGKCGICHKPFRCTIEEVRQ